MKQWLQALSRGTLNRCPKCGQGAIFASLTRQNPTCPSCGVTFQPYEGDYLGAMAIAYTITATATLLGYLAFSRYVAWGDAAQVCIWGGFATVFYFAFYRNMKGLWVGFLYLMTGLEKTL